MHYVAKKKQYPSNFVHEYNAAPCTYYLIVPLFHYVSMWSVIKLVMHTYIYMHYLKLAYPFIYLSCTYTQSNFEHLCC